MQRILKDNGSIWVIGSYHNIFRLGYHLQNLVIGCLTMLFGGKIIQCQISGEQDLLMHTRHLFGHQRLKNQNILLIINLSNV